MKTLEEIREEKRRKAESVRASDPTLIGAPLQSGVEQRQEGVLHARIKPGPSDACFVC